MNLKEKMKRFWTLNVHNHEGFTLVELIIVIAILAILSSVAVVGYSSYVTKANKQADLTLAAEIENALMLAYYSDKLTPGDYVVIYFDKDAEYGNDSNASANTIYAAMEAAYGSEWEKVLKLKHSGWAEELGALTNSTFGEYIEGSSFDPNVDGALKGFLKDVNDVTLQLSGFLSGVNNLQGGYKNFLDSYGINYQTDTTAASNAAAMYVAGDIQTKLKDQNIRTAFENAWGGAFNPSAGGVELPKFDQFGTLPGAAAQYAFVEGLVTYLDRGNGGTKYTDLLNAAKPKITDDSSLVAQLNSIIDVINTDINTAFASENTAFVALAFDYFGQGPQNTNFALNDARAFAGYMEGIASSTDSLMEDTNLNNPEYYTDGTMLEYIRNYISIGEILDNINIPANTSAFVFIFNGNSVACAPLDY